MTTEAPPTAVAEVPPPPTEKEGKRGRATPWLFMSPTLLIVVLFYAAPVVLIFVLSFTDMSSAQGLRNWNFIGTANYEQLLNHPNAAVIAWATVFYVGVTLGLFNVGLGLVIALQLPIFPDVAGSSSGGYGSFPGSPLRWCTSSCGGISLNGCPTG